MVEGAVVSALQLSISASSSLSKKSSISKSIIDIINLMQTGTTVYQASGEIVDICKHLKMVVFSKSESSPLHRRAERAKKKSFICVYINASILPCPH